MQIIVGEVQSIVPALPVDPYELSHSGVTPLDLAKLQKD
jgi:hypothetical protein